MPRYHFELINGHRLPDPSGIECASEAEAQEYGRQIAAQIAAEVPSSIAKRHISIIDNDGREIAKLEVGVDGSQ
jgi:hypothetical protein